MNNTNQNRGNSHNQNYQGRPNGNNTYKNNDNIPITLPDGYLINGYFTDANKEKRDKDYIIKYAKQIADSLEKEGKGGGGLKNKRTQIRKYYDYSIRVRDKLQSKNDDISYIEADIAQLRSTVAYAKSRGVVSAIFEKFITKNVEKITDAKDYYAFMKHFEAIVAFMKKD